MRFFTTLNSNRTMRKLARLEDERVSKYVTLPTPRELKQQYPITAAGKRTVAAARQAIIDMMTGKDRRMLAIVGPCSLHNEHEALKYAHRLRECAETVQDDVVILMRAYFEKPRTTIGWKGMIYEPDLNGESNIQKGVRLTRKVASSIVNLGVPIATELLSPNLFQLCLADLVSYASLGARTSSSQIHWEISSGLTCPVGVKNPVTGDVTPAIDALESIRHVHSFASITQQGKFAEVFTKGNKWSHIILRGGKVPNYDSDAVGAAQDQLRDRKLSPFIIVDCSHGNSGKIAANQKRVLESVIKQRLLGNNDLGGVMIESNLASGKQPVQPLENLLPGISVTDDCLGIDDTISLLRAMRLALQKAR